jgi:chromosome segregation ATPase
MKSEWNKEKVSRLQAQLEQINTILANEPMSSPRAKALGIHRAKLNEAIILLKDRAVSFDGMLSDYMNATGEYDNAEGEYDSAEGDYDNADGDYDNAEGEYSEARGKKSAARAEKKEARKAARTERKQSRQVARQQKREAKKVSRVEKRRRKAEVRAAKKSARKARAVARKDSRMAKRATRRNVTEVEQELDPQISENRIEIPAEELNYGGNPETIEQESNATGIIALDGMNNFDAPKEYTYSSANGLKNVNWKGVLIGVAVAGLAIWGAKKAKLF